MEREKFLELIRMNMLILFLMSFVVIIGIIIKVGIFSLVAGPLVATIGVNLLYIPYVLSRKTYHIEENGIRNVKSNQLIPYDEIIRLVLKLEKDHFHMIYINRIFLFNGRNGITGRIKDPGDDMITILDEKMVREKMKKYFRHDIYFYKRR